MTGKNPTHLLQELQELQEMTSKVKVSREGEELTKKNNKDELLRFPEEIACASKSNYITLHA